MAGQFDEYELADGTLVQFPKGTPVAEVNEHLTKNYQDSLNYTPPTDESSFTDNPNPVTRFAQSFSGGFKRGIDQIVPGIQAGLATIGGGDENQQEWEEAQKELAESSLRNAKANPDPSSAAEIQQKYNQEGFWSAAGETIDFASQSIGQSLGVMAPSLAMLAGAAYSGPLAALGLGGAAISTRFSQYFAETIERSAQDGTVTAEDANLAKVLASATGQVALEGVSLAAAGVVAPALRAAFTAGSPVVRGAANKAVAEGVKEAASRTFGQSAGRFMSLTALETATETGQLALERAGAGETLTPQDEEDMHEFIENFWGAALGSGPFSAYGTYKYYKQPEVEAKARKAEEEKAAGIIADAEKQREKVRVRREAAILANGNAAIAKRARLKQEMDADLESMRAVERDRARIEADGIRAIPRTMDDIRGIAKEQGIDIDSSPRARVGFTRVVNEIAGTHNVDQLTPTQMELVYNELARTISTRDKTTPTPFNPVSNLEVEEIANAVEKAQKKSLNRDEMLALIRGQLKKSKHRGDANVYARKDYDSVRAVDLMNRMLDEGYLIESKPGKQKLYKSEVKNLRFLTDEHVSQAAAQMIDMAGRSVRIGKTAKGTAFDVVGEFPSLNKVRESMGSMRKDVYDDIKDALIARGIIGTKGKSQKLFIKDIPDILATDVEFSRNPKVVDKWIVRDQDGATAYVARNRKEANEFVKKNPGDRFQEPQQERGWTIRETEYLNEDGKNPRYLRSRPVDFLREDKASEADVDAHIQKLGDRRRARKAEYLGSMGDPVKSDLDPELVRKARSEDERDRAEAREVLTRSPFRLDSVMKRYRVGVEPDSLATKDTISLGRQDWKLSIDGLGRMAKAMKVTVKEGTLTEDGRGFGKARFKERIPDYQAKLDNLFQRIDELGDGAFENTSAIQAFPLEPGRIQIVDGMGDTADVYILDLIEGVDDNGQPEGSYHVYNIFKGNDKYSEMVEDLGPLRGLPEQRGQDVTNESVRVAENPNHESVRKFTEAEKYAENVSLSLGAENFATTDVESKPKGLIGFFNDFIVRNWGDDAPMRLRQNLIDAAASIRKSDERLADALGLKLDAIVSADAMVRMYKRMPHMMFQSLEKGYVKFRKQLTADGQYEGAGSFEIEDYSPVNNTRINGGEGATFYNPSTGLWETGHFDAELFTDTRGNTTGGIMTILSALGPGRVQRMFQYKLAKRAKRIIDKNKTLPFKDRIDVPIREDEVQKWMTLDPDTDGDIVVAAHNLEVLNERLVDNMVEAGVLSPDMANQWLENSDYIPFYREFEGEANTEFAKRMDRMRIQLGIQPHLLGDLHNRMPFQKYKGWKREAGDEAFDALKEPIAAMLNNQLAALTASVANQVRQRTLRNEIANGTARLWTEAEHAGQPSVTVRVKGKDVKYFVDDTTLFTALEGQFGNSAFERLQMSPIFQKLITAPSQWLRDTVTRNPGFAIPNMIRDAMIVWMVNPGAGPEFVLKSAHRAAQNIINDIKGNPRHETSQLLEDYGVTTGIDAVNSVNNSEDMAVEIQKKLDMKKDGVIGKAWKAMGRYSAHSESATRELVYEHTKKVTMERLRREGKYNEADIDVIARNEALHQAKEILNFNTKGSNQGLALVSAMAPFINARLQGMDIVGRGLLNYGSVGMDVNATGDQIQKNFLRRGMFVAAASAALQMMLMDDEDYENEPAYSRDDNFYIPVPGGFIKIPAPFEPGFLFKTIPEQIVRGAILAYRDQGSQAERDAFRALINFSNNTFGPGQAVPVALRPAAEWAMNSTFHSGVPIEPFWEQQLPATERFGVKTTAQARAIGSVTGHVGISPRRVDSAIRAITGGLGAHIWASMDTILRMPAGILPDWPVPVKPTPKLSDIAVIRRLASTGEAAGLKVEFYEYRQELMEYKAMIDRAATPARQRELRKKYAPAVKALAKLKGIDKQINLLRKQEIEIRENKRKKRSAAEMRQAIDENHRKQRKALRKIREQRIEFDRNR